MRNSFSLPRWQRSKV